MLKTIPRWLEPYSKRFFSTTIRTSLSAPSFPCVDANEQRTQKLLSYRSNSQKVRRENAPEPVLPFNLPDNTTALEDSGPEPAYANTLTGFTTFSYDEPFALTFGFLPRFDIAYETWGTLNADKSNAILLHTGLSASSHAHSSPSNPIEGWWEKFIGPNRPLDTNKYFIICTNVLGGCYGSTGPSSLHPEDNKPYGTRFPVLTIHDMVRAQFKLLDSLGIDKLYASVGSSMGGMQSLSAAWVEKDRVGRVVSISGTARSSPSSIAMRHAQRSVLMSDPNWNRGFYYDALPPHTGMKLARQIATITYRSGPEWEQRFGRKRRNLSTTNEKSAPVLCPDFLIETYLDHQGESFCLKYDANSLLYVSKAMDLFDMSVDSLEDEHRRWTENVRILREGSSNERSEKTACELSQGPPKEPKQKQFISSLPSSHAYLPQLRQGLTNLTHPTLVLGVQSDTLFPIEQQRELAECIRANGNGGVVYYELNAPWGHDTFLLDVGNVGGAIKGFLSYSDEKKPTVV